MGDRAYGIGSIYQRKSGQWVAAVQLPHKRGETRKRKTFTGATREAVEARLAAYRAQHPAPEFPGRTESQRQAREQGTHRQSEWWALYRRVKGACHYCGVTTDPSLSSRLDPLHAEKDHLVPLSRGGSDAIENIVVACRACNRDKGTMTADEYAAWKATR